VSHLNGRRIGETWSDWLHRRILESGLSKAAAIDAVEALEENAGDSSASRRSWAERILEEFTS